MHHRHLHDLKPSKENVTARSFDARVYEALSSKTLENRLPFDALTSATHANAYASSSSAVFLRLKKYHTGSTIVILFTHTKPLGQTNVTSWDASDPPAITPSSLSNGTRTNERTCPPSPEPPPRRSRLRSTSAAPRARASGTSAKRSISVSMDGLSLVDSPMMIDPSIHRKTRRRRVDDWRRVRRRGR